MRCARARALLLLLLAVALGGGIAHAQQTPITRYTRLTGNINFVATGGSLRSQDNNGNACAVKASDTASLTGIPVGASVVAAYLYWGGSGATIDSSVILNGSGVTAGRTFTATFNNGGTAYPYFGAFADVTSRVTGNGTFTFSGLTVATGAPHCGTSAVAAGWSLVVVYGSASERLRAINVFDGLEPFRGSQLTLNPDGFLVPASAIDGRIAIVAIEGDPGNSDPLGGFSEALRFNGTTLDDGINVPGSSPLVQPYDGTVNAIGSATSYGFDVDTFDVSTLLAPGQTSATTQFSAGGDLVLLLAQIVSVTSQPTVDLSITKTHSGNFAAGTNGTYTLRVSNAAGQQREDNVVTVTDTLPAGLGFVSGAGVGWTCSAAGQDVTCTHPPILDPGQSLPDLTLTVAVSGAAVPAVTNTAQVSSGSFDIDASNNTASDATVVVGSNLATSTKTVVDPNGGEVDAGDTLRYTITLIETGGIAASGVGVTDPLPANTTGLTVVSVPTGAIDSSTPTQLDVSGITVPANGTATIVFEVTVPIGTSPGTLIDNTATVTNPTGAGATPAAPQVIVSPSQIPSGGTKPLYIHSTPALPLTRVPATSAEPTVNLTANTSQQWVLTPQLQLPVTLAGGNVVVPLWLSRTSGGAVQNRQVTVTLANSVLGVIDSATQTVSPPNSPTPALFTFTLATAADTYPAGSTFSLTIARGGGGGTTRVHPFGVSSASRVELNSNTVINVDSVTSFDQAYPAGTATTSFQRGDTVHVRAIVSDPFGSADITGARVDLVDANNVVQVANAAMTQVADSGAATRTYEYAYTLPVNAAIGGWSMRVTATEGTEGTVTDLGVGGFTVAQPLPTLLVSKVSEVLDDPVNGATNPKRIPGAVVRYTIGVSNSGPGPVDASTLLITDPVPANSMLYVATGGGGPIEFIDGSPASGLAFNPATDVTYSNQPGGGAPYTYTPVPDGQGYDAAVTGVRIAPTGTMNAAGGGGQPSFSIRLRVRIR
ncbi:MAG: hypothetical protein NAOJABEB_02194 [Steroidobacteraceae bacterium]|nr:hypothetical protein [Steroidobacteraceae bacterium]